MNNSDISLSIRVDDVSLLELVFQVGSSNFEGAHLVMELDNPQNDFNMSRADNRALMQSTVSVKCEMHNVDGDESSNPLMIFGTTLGVVVSVPIPQSAAGDARHMAGVDYSTARRDSKMTNALRLEAIKHAHAFASMKLSELSAMSVCPKIALPPIDPDALLRDLKRHEVEWGI